MWLVEAASYINEGKMHLHMENAGMGGSKYNLINKSA